MNLLKNYKSILVLLILQALAGSIYGTNTLVQPSVEFEFDSLEIEEGSAMTICLELTNADPANEEYKVEVAFKGTSLPHFAGQQKRIITFQEKTYCFSIKASMHTTSQNDVEYLLGLSVINPVDMELGDNYQMTILVENVDPEATALGIKSLAFVAYDNQITSGGSDRIAIMNTVPLTSQSSFTIASAEYDSIAGLNMWTGRNRDLMSAIEVTYTGTATIPVASVIEFTIDHSSSGDRLFYFEVNNTASTNFATVNVGDETEPDLDLSTSAGNSLYLVDGIFEALDTQYVLMGSVIDGIHVGYNTPVYLPPNLEGNSVIVTQTGSTWGIIDCGNGEIYLCDFIGLVGDVTNWSIQTGTNANNLPSDILNTICDPLECPEGEIEFYSACDYEKVDYIFLIDNSASVTNQEYEDMHESIDQTILEIDNVNSDARYAIAQFSNPGQFTISVEFTFDVNEAIDFDREYSAYTDVRGAVEDVIESIDQGPLELRSEAIFQFIIYTDAAATEYSWNPQFGVSDDFEPYNAIKLPPYNAITSVVRYQGDEDQLANPIAASIASIGGSYYGGLGNNSDDPDGNSQPRRLYIADEFTDPLTDLLEDVTECTLLEAILDAPCADPVYEWIASNGGEIISYNGPFIETNEEGTYTVNVLCNGECEYSGEYEYPSGGGSMVSAPSGPRGVMVDGIFLTPGQYEEYTQVKLVLPQAKANPGFSVHIMPNPNKGAFNVFIQSAIDDQVEVSIETLSGMEVWSTAYPVIKGENQFHVSESLFVEGMYLLRIQGALIKSVHKVVVTR